MLAIRVGSGLRSCLVEWSEDHANQLYTYWPFTHIYLTNEPCQITEYFIDENLESHYSYSRFILYYIYIIQSQDGVHVTSEPFCLGRVIVVIVVCILRNLQPKTKARSNCQSLQNRNNSVNFLMSSQSYQDMNQQSASIFPATKSGSILWEAVIKHCLVRQCIRVYMQRVDQSGFNYTIIRRGHTSVDRQLHFYTPDVHRTAIAVHFAAWHICKQWKVQPQPRPTNRKQKNPMGMTISQYGCITYAAWPLLVSAFSNKTVPIIIVSPKCTQQCNVYTVFYVRNLGCGSAHSVSLNRQHI